MIANTLLATIAILLAGGFWLLGQLKFLIPYRHILFHQYGDVILLWLAILFVNVFAGFVRDPAQVLSQRHRPEAHPRRQPGPRRQLPLALPNRDRGARVNVPRFHTARFLRSRSRSF